MYTQLKSSNMYTQSRRDVSILIIEKEMQQNCGGRGITVLNMHSFNKVVVTC